ncbi:WD-40 repeat-containing protein [Streptomyces venezuelae]|uniref:nSTAND1 domain-containing NTPase n=1 Tax=Streptomyces gardneri TaxID=66892 RepID=UPI0006BCC183|nr:trypsin-like peptidase domain-containing protein [Streptomyces gardneri]ALO06875.1 WD-40 repeat-containing protein [Streptomyces venezuelae]QPK44256.1 trypsin-like peptidase domain-containing protein [Streptomyces gardneri]WRK35541.1 trypsin-like peptidase domain-containing protein [Streptomyces venezuelae]CUM42830.1 WD-40 repeat protein [Streptomyces venezuelae]
MTERPPSHDEIAEEALAAATVRITGPAGVAGVGVLIAPELVLTCAHVVTDAAGLPRGHAEPPGGRLTVRLLQAHGDAESVTARVRDWVPERPDGRGDLAVLRLGGALPGARPVVMADPPSTMAHRALVLGLPDNVAEGGWHTATLHGRTGIGWLQMSPDGASDPIRPGFSGAGVWDKETGAVVGVVTATASRPGGLSFCIPTRTITEQVPALAGLLAPRSPFPGLHAFTEDDTRDFFGRDADVAAILGLLEAGGPTGCTTLTGPSGSGKSSVLMAGVVPRLKEQGVEVVLVRAVSGRRIAPPPALPADGGHRRVVVAVDQAEALLTLPDGELRDTVGRLLEAAARPGTEVLIVVRSDFQDAVLSHPELGRLVGGAPAHQLGPMTVRQLTEAVVRPLEGIPGVEYGAGLAARIVEDTVGRPGALPLLGFLLETLWEQRRGGHLRFDAYERLGGVGRALGERADAAWDDVRGGDDPSPAARSLLRALVRIPPGTRTALRARLLRRDAGEERWAVARALADSRILVLGVDEEGRETVELAHEALIAHWRPLTELLAEDRAFLEWLGTLRYDGQRWRREGRPDGHLLEDPALALAEERLAKQGDELTEDDREFIRRSGELRDRRGREAARSATRARRVRLLTAIVAVVSSLALVVGAFLYRGMVAEQRRLTSDRLAQQVASLDGVSLTTSSLFAVGAYRAADRQPARSTLIAQDLRMRDVDRVVMEGQSDVRALSFTGSGEQVYALLDGGDVVQLDLRTADAERPEPWARTRTGDNARFAVSPNGRVMARSSEWGVVSLGVHASEEAAFDHGAKVRYVPLRGAEAAKKNPRPASDLRFDGGGDRVLAAIRREGVLVWRTADGGRAGRTLTPPKGWDAVEAWFGADDTVVSRIVPAGAARDDAPGRLLAWDLATGAPKRPWGERAAASATVSGDGRTLVTCTAQGTLEVWRLGREPRRAHTYTTTTVEVCPLHVPRLDTTGRYLVNPVGRMGGDLGRMRFLVADLEKGWPGTFDVPSPAPEDASVTGRNGFPAVALSGPPDDLRAAVAVGGSIVTVRVRPPDAFDTNVLLSGFRTADGEHRRLAVVDATGGVLQLWDLKTRALMGSARSPKPLARLYTTFSPDGSRVLTVTEDRRSMLVWRLTEGASGPGTTHTLTMEHELELPAPPDLTAKGPDPLTGLTPSWIVTSFADDRHAVISGLSYMSRWDLDTGRQDGRPYRPSEQEKWALAGAAASTWGAAVPGTRKAVVRTVGEVGSWDFDTGEYTRWIARGEHGESVRGLLVSPDGKRLAVQYAGGSVRIWDIGRKTWEGVLTGDGVYALGRFLDERGDTLHTMTRAGEQVVWDTRDKTMRYRYWVRFDTTLSPNSTGERITAVEGSRPYTVPLDAEASIERLCALAQRGPTQAERERAGDSEEFAEACGSG